VGERTAVTRLADTLRRDRETTRSRGRPGPPTSTAALVGLQRLVCGPEPRGGGDDEARGGGGSTSAQPHGRSRRSRAVSEMQTLACRRNRYAHELNPRTGSAVVSTRSFRIPPRVPRDDGARFARAALASSGSAKREGVWVARVRSKLICGTGRKMAVAAR